VGAGPEPARVVVVTPAARAEVTVVGAAAAFRVVTVVLGALEAVVEGCVAAVVADVSVTTSVELVVLLGGPAMANWPPRRNDGGPLWVIW
jgi:hypothetical protein